MPNVENKLSDHIPADALARIVDTVTNGAMVGVIDDKGKVLFANERLLEGSRFSLAELQAMDARTFMLGPKKMLLSLQMARSMALGKPWRGEVETHTKDGEPIWTDTTIVQTTGAGGKKEIVYIAFVINEKKVAESELGRLGGELGKSRLEMNRILETFHKQRNRIEQTETWLKAVLSDMGDGVVVVDLQGRVQLINRAFTKIYGWRERDLLGRRFFEVVRANDGAGKLRPAEERPLNLAISRRTAYTFGIEDGLSYLHKDGWPIPTAVTVAPLLEGGECIGAVGLYRDATKEKAVDEAKSQFVTLVSHQLRTPLSTVSWYVERLLSGELGPLNARQRKYLDEVYSSNIRMTNMIGSLLDISRFEMGEVGVKVEPIDIASLVKTVVADHKAQIESKRLDVRQEFLGKIPLLFAQQKLVRVVIDNLVSNAIKYTQDRGKVQVRVSGRGNEVLLEVKDNGFGIPADQADRIFSRFFRADNIKLKVTDGSGLGLYLTKQVVDTLGGEIWFESREGYGSLFSVRFPTKVSAGITPVVRQAAEHDILPAKPTDT